MRWRNLLGASVAAVISSACGVGTAAAPTVAPAPTAAPSVAAAATPTRSPVPGTATPAPQPTPAAEAAASETVWVGNTDGEGVYIRKTPVMADRIRAYPDGTELTIIGDDVEGDGQHWKHVRTPDGLEGYVPSIYTVDTPP